MSGTLLLLLFLIGSASPAPTVTPQQTLTAGFLDKRLCSGLWVNARERDDFLENDILLGRELLTEIDLQVDEKRRRVQAMNGCRTNPFRPGSTGSASPGLSNRPSARTRRSPS